MHIVQKKRDDLRVVARAVYGRVVMKSVGEKSILNIVEAVQMMRERRDKDTILEQPPKAESSSNGGAEQSNKEVEGMIRTLKRSIERENWQISGRTRGVHAVVGSSPLYNYDTNKGGRRQSHTLRETEKGSHQGHPRHPWEKACLANWTKMPWARCPHAIPGSWKASTWAEET